MDSGDAPEYVVALREGARVTALHAAGDRAPHWSNYVSVEDVDVVARYAQELGGSVSAGPFDVPSSVAGPQSLTLRARS